MAGIFYQADQAPPERKYGLRSFVDGPAKEQDSWGIMDDFTMDDECQLCSRQISKLVFSGLTGADTIHCWISRRIQPLQYRSVLMCEYSRIDDPQRYSKEELSSEEIERRIRNIIKVGRDEKLELKIPMYENGNCPEVSAFLFHYNRLFFLTNLHFPAAFLPSPFRAEPSGPLSPIKGTYRR
jgi:hypothetical protein